LPKEKQFIVQPVFHLSSYKPSQMRTDTFIERFFENPGLQTE